MSESGEARRAGMLGVATRPRARPRRPAQYQWADRVATRSLNLPPALASGLAAGSFGMARAHARGLSAAARALAPVVGRSANTARQRLRGVYPLADPKRGRNRTALDPADGTAPRVRWVTAGWADQRVAIASDATDLGDRFHMPAAAVVYRGCGIPVAGAVLPAHAIGPWNPHRVRLLERVADALGPGGRAVVRTDRGLESADLFRAIVTHGFHPLMRAKGGSFRPTGRHNCHRPDGLGTAGRFAAAGTAYRTAPLGYTLLACRADGCADPWLILTDLLPPAADPCWYAFRSWIEQGFEVIKSDRWQWQRTRMADPGRAERLWLAVSLATLWRVEVGGRAEGEPRPETVPRFRTAGRPRTHRLFRVGGGLIPAGRMAGHVPAGTFAPEPWPEV